MLRLVAILTVLISLWFPSAMMGQSRFTISGEVRDATTGESLIGALVGVKDRSKGVATNVYGFFSLTLPSGDYSITATLVGYETDVRTIVLNADQRIVIELKPKVYEQKTIVIEAEGKTNTESTDIGKIELEVEQIKKLPVLLGEIDILKTISLLPGVQSAGEGNAGFYVRGGGIDQNLILLDNSVVYNASHLFGFFSVFNADAVKNLELTKGGVPANYGGRLASVLDINLKEGNAKDYNGAGGIGTVASRFTVEGPIKKDTSSFIISGRRTYIDALVKPFIKPESNFSGSGYYFYDLNAKFNYRISRRDQLFISGYFGRDVFSFSSASAGFKTHIPWGNATATLRWNRVVNERLFMNTLLTFTDYKFEFKAAQESFTFGLKSGIRDYGAKVQWSYYPDYRHNIKFGFDYTFHDFTPNNTYASSGDTQFDLGPRVHLYSHEAALYAMDEFDLTEDFRISAGIRLSHFIHVGPFDRYIPKEETSLFGQPAEPEIIHYEKGKKIKSYTGPEPRLSMRYTLDKNSSIKLGYMRNYQYIHLTSLSPSSLPTDVWLPSTDVMRPQKGWQLSLGYFRNFDNDQWESSVEIYYKDMQNVSEYREGAQPQQTVKDNIDNLLVFGRGYSYGAEFFLKRRIGKLNGWAGYTWSKTERVFDEINDGNPYPARWDRRHDVSFVANYQLSKRVEFGFVFVYGTGNAITLPLERYFIEGRVVDIYGARNSFRMAPYHRADISCTIHQKTVKRKKDKISGEIIERPKRFKSNWNFSVYNLYNRKNPYFIYFGTNGQLTNGTLQVRAYQVSLFPVLPSITWNFEF
ncbi:MAG: TonB-dependent receptor [Crocinitomicaceae bacterium]|nr:TonB-dependent receptor [Crocinitomicaceae bacterium]